MLFKQRCRDKYVKITKDLGLLLERAKRFLVETVYPKVGRGSKLQPSFLKSVSGGRSNRLIRWRSGWMGVTVAEGLPRPAAPKSPLLKANSHP